MRIAILSKIQPNPPKRNLLPPRAGRILLENIEMQWTLLQHGVALNGQAHRHVLFVVVRDLVVSNLAFGRSATVLGGGRGCEMPFDEGGPRDEGDVVEVVDLCVLGSFGRDDTCDTHPQSEIEFWLFASS